MQSETPMFFIDSLKKEYERYFVSHYSFEEYLIERLWFCKNENEKLNKRILEMNRFQSDNEPDYGEE